MAGGLSMYQRTSGTGSLDRATAPQLIGCGPLFQTGCLISASVHKLSTIEGNLLVPGCTVACWEMMHKITFQRQISTEQLEGNKSPVSFLSG